MSSQVTKCIPDQKRTCYTTQTQDGPHILKKKNPDPSQNRYCNCTWKWHLNHCRSKWYEHSVFSIAACMHPFIHLFLLPVAAVFIITDWIALVSLDLWESGNQKYHQQMWLLPSFVVFKGVLLCLIWNGTALVLKVLGRKVWDITHAL